MSDQGQSTEASIEERILNIIDPLPEKKEEVAAEEPEEFTSETEVPAEEDVEEEVVEEKTEDLDWDKLKDLELEITVQGEKGKVTLEEARLGYMRTSDYQKKTQELATQRKSVVDEATQVVQQVQDNYVEQLQTLEAAVQKLAMQELSNVDLNWMAESDPTAYVKYQHRMNQFNQVLQSITDEANKAKEAKSRQAQTERAQMLEQGMSELKTRIPNFSKEVESKLMEAGNKYGFSENELKSIADPRVLHVLNDARQFRELSAGKPQIMKKAADAPRVIKPGSKPAIKSDGKGQELKERIKASGGKDEDALTAFIKRTMR